MFKSESRFLHVEELLSNFGENHCRAQWGEKEDGGRALFLLFRGLVPGPFFSNYSSAGQSGGSIFFILQMCRFQNQ
jgi:hypothetical protein